MRRWIPQALVQKVTGCAAVSACSSVVSQVLLAVLALLWPPALANVAVVTATSVPAYVANRRFVWRVQHNSKAAAGFVVSNLAGLALSTVAVAVAAATWDAAWAVNVASFGSWVVLWPLTFVLNDRLLFRS